MVMLEGGSCCSSLSAVLRKFRSDILERHFSWKGQYLVMLEGDSCCYAHCTGRFMCDGDQS